MKIHTEKRTKHSIVFYENELIYVMPSRVEGMVGERWINLRALPLHRARLICPKKWRVGSEPEQRQRDQSIALILAIKSSAIPPRVSVSRGMQSRPLERKLGRFAASLR